MTYKNLVEKNSFDLTVFIATYNRSEYLSDCLKSILSQSVNDFYIVVLDNASTDDTEQVVKKLADERTVYQKNPINVGGIGNLNIALKTCLTKYCVIFHDDDMMAPKMIEIERDIIRKFGFDAVASKSKLDREYNSLKYRNDDEINFLLYDNDKFISNLTTPIGNVIVCPSVMFNMDFMNHYNLRFNKDVGPCCDLFMWCEICRYGGTICDIQKALMIYRQHNMQDSIKNSTIMNIQYFNYTAKIDYYNIFYKKGSKYLSKKFNTYILLLIQKYSNKDITRQELIKYCRMIPIESIKSSLLLNLNIWFAINMAPLYSKIFVVIFFIRNKIKKRVKNIGK